MRTPPRCQVTEHDCVPTTFVNALAMLFDREDVPAPVLQRIYLYSLDKVRRGGVIGKGTSDPAMKRLVIEVADGPEKWHCILAVRKDADDTNGSTMPTPT